MLPILEKIHEKGNYSPTRKDVRRWHGILNQIIFGGIVPKFRNIEIKKVPGQFAAVLPKKKKKTKERYADLEIDTEFEDFKSFIMILAHEMIHAWQWINFEKMPHGKTFFQWKEKLAEQEIPLNIKYAKKNMFADAIKSLDIPKTTC